jgi:hypothetical protein
MNATMSGKKIASDTQKLGEKFQDGVYTTATDPAGAQGGAIAGAFQRAFGGRSRMDDKMRMRDQISDAQGNTPFGQLTYTDEVGRWLEDKAEKTEEANFDAWFGANFNKSNLADRQIAQSLNPKYYSEREKFMRERTEAALRLKLIQLRGPQSEDDMYMLYLVETGRVELPEDWDRIGPVLTGPMNNANEEQKFKDRLFRLPRITSQFERARNARGNQANGAFGNVNAAGASAFNWQGGQFGGFNGMFSRAPGSVASQFQQQLQ